MKVYRVFAYLVAAGVLFQAATIAYALFALGSWIDKGNALDKGTETFPGVGGLEGHGVGSMVVAGLALVFLVVSFFTHVPGGVKWAAITFGLVVLQFVLGIASHSLAGLGVLHGINAFAVFGVALMAAMRAPRAVRSGEVVRDEVPAPVA